MKNRYKVKGYDNKDDYCTICYASAVWEYESNTDPRTNWLPGVDARYAAASKKTINVCILWNIQSRLITPLMRSTSDAPFLCSDTVRLNVKVNANVCSIQEIHKLWPLQSWNDKSADTEKQQMDVCPDFIGSGVERKLFEHCTNLMCNHSVLKHQFCSSLPVTWLGLGRRPPFSPESNLVAGKLRSPCPHLNYASKPSTSLVMLQS